MQVPQKILTLLQNHFVAGYGSFSDCLKAVVQVFHGEALLFRAAYVEDYFSCVHHKETVAVIECLLHVVGYHHYGKIVLVSKFFCKLHYDVGIGRIKSRSVFVQEENLRL